MSVYQLPPSGVFITTTVEIPATSLGSVSAVSLEGVWEGIPLGFAQFDVTLRKTSDGSTVPYVNGDYRTSSQMFQRDLPLMNPVEEALYLDAVLEIGGGVPASEEKLTLTARSAQVSSGRGALTLDSYGEPVTYGEPVEVAVIDVLTWRDWYLLTDRDGSNPEVGS